MEDWISAHWFDLVQTIGIVGGLIFTAHAIRRDERARRITNMIAVNERYSQIWQEFYQRPELSRILKKDVDLSRAPVSDEEWLFVKMLLLHLDTVRRATEAKVFVRIQGLQRDIQEFLALPIPKTVWEKIMPFQDKGFVRFIESCLNADNLLKSAIR